MPALNNGPSEPDDSKIRTPLTPPPETQNIDHATRVRPFAENVRRRLVSNSQPHVKQESVISDNGFDDRNLSSHSIVSPDDGSTTISKASHVARTGHEIKQPRDYMEAKSAYGTADAGEHGGTQAGHISLNRRYSSGMTQLNPSLSKSSTEKSKELTDGSGPVPHQVLPSRIMEESPTNSPQRPGLPLRNHSTLTPGLTNGSTWDVTNRKISHERSTESRKPQNLTIETGRDVTKPPPPLHSARPPSAARAMSTPASIRSPSVSATIDFKKGRTVSKSDHSKAKTRSVQNDDLPSPMPISIPLPPLSIPTYLQLELSSHRPSQLYIHRSADSEFPYESSRVKIERLLNFIFLPFQLEGVLWFGALACLDCWLYTFTILPLRLLKSLYILCQSWSLNIANESRYLSGFVFAGSQRMWQRRRTRGYSNAPPFSRTNSEVKTTQDGIARPRARSARHHRRTKSRPSMLLPDDKADILKGLLIICTCLVLSRLDASRMYHWVRGQAAIKLYVIYNLLEVCDRLLSALGQDVLECLFSREALERKPDGHSKILRPFWLFILALVYTVTHATALFYQVITLNVAVNAYSNALITLLMSNQFVEIKSTVFKKFEKENLFQLTCADIVERFQLWHMLMIIASRNIVETGGFNMGIGAFTATTAMPPSPTGTNITHIISPRMATSILPRSFTIIPSMLSSLTTYVPVIGHVMGPFIIVLGSEMAVDWLKHAYINKFNNTRPVIYSRFLDVLAKDYYTNAFGDQNLTKRLGLPVLPLSCLMIRAGSQTYQMIVAAWVPMPSQSTSTSLASIHEQYTASRVSAPTSRATEVLQRMDAMLGQLPSTLANSVTASHFTTALILLLMFLVLLVIKLMLGMALLAFSRSRYRNLKESERKTSYHVEGGRRVGGWGVVEVDEDKRRWIYDDDPTALKALRDKESKESAKREQEREKGLGLEGLEKVKRYEMAAKRIW